MPPPVREDGALASSAPVDVEQRWRRLSLWWDGLDGPLTARPALAGDTDVDVAIVGGGFTGLWTAYYLLQAQPGTRVAVLEADVAGSGASGRNGGWCSALFAASGTRMARDYGPDAARAMLAAMRHSVDEVGRASAAEGIDCRFAKGGTVVVARNPAQKERARSEVAEAQALGLGADDLRWLEPSEAAQMITVTGMLGATYTPHCAALDPARLARGLARAVERLGGHIYEQSAVDDIIPGATGRRPVARANGATVRADVIVRALEGWTPVLPGYRRVLAPVYSLMIATEPLPTTFWDEAGLAQRQTFSDGRHLIIYGQRTADGRLAFGGRGAPYHFGSAVRPDFDRVPEVHGELRRALVELFPALAEVEVTHAWGGPLGVPRDWFSSVGLDRATGLGWAGGYVGDGVSTTNLAGRTLADLVLGHDSDLVRLPWVGHISPEWETEPWRWLGARAALWAAKQADRSQQHQRRPSWLARRLEHLVGH
jgi:glycine/D-amino acid oxidase-like deaminating enzyme